MPPCFLITSKWCRVLCHGAIETQPSTIEIWFWVFPVPILAITWARPCCRRVSLKDYQMSRGKKPKLSAESEYFCTYASSSHVVLRHWWRGWRIYPRMHLSAIVQWTSHYYCNLQFYFSNACRQRQRTTQRNRKQQNTQVKCRDVSQSKWLCYHECSEVISPWHRPCSPQQTLVNK